MHLDAADNHCLACQAIGEEFRQARTSCVTGSGGSEFDGNTYQLRNINTGDRMSKTWLSQLLLAFLRARCDKVLPNTKMIEDLRNA